nr:PREDICTED: uncharacterized protein LOC105272163 [Fopius arisanus]
MRVGLAVQICSNSVAHRMELYKRKVEELKDSASSVDFCHWINRTCDALNRTKDLSGATSDSVDYKIIQNSLSRLDDRETAVKSRKISPNSFLTKPTAEELRVAFRSTLDLLEFLIKQCSPISAISENEFQKNEVFSNLQLKPTFQRLREMYPSVLTHKLGLYKYGKFALEWKDKVNLILVKPRVVPYAMIDKIEVEIERLVKDEVISPV